MNNLLTIIVSVLALIISIFSAGYNILTKEFGLLKGDTEYSVRVLKDLNMFNHPSGLHVVPTIQVRNEGTLPLTITKAKAMVKFGEHHKIFDQSILLTINAGGAFSKNIKLYQKFPDADILKRSILGSNIINDLTRKFHKRDNDNSPLFISENLFSNTGKYLNKNTDWMIADDEFYILIMLWLNDDEKKVIKKLFKFKVTEFQLKVLREFQHESWHTPRSDIFKANLFTTHFIKTQLQEIENTSKIDLMYKLYKSVE